MQKGARQQRRGGEREIREKIREEPTVVSPTIAGANTTQRRYLDRLVVGKSEGGG